MKYFWLFFIFIIGCSNKINNADTWPENRRDPIELPVKIKIDKDFSEWQKVEISRAMTAWMMASSGKVKFVVIWDQPQPGLFKDFVPLIKNQGMFMWKLNRDSEHFTEALRNELSEFDAVTFSGIEQASQIVMFTHIHDWRFYRVALHEFGHLLGLMHIDQPEVVMSRSAGNDCITEFDAVQLCQLYKCVPKPEC